MRKIFTNNVLDRLLGGPPRRKDLVALMDTRGKEVTFRELPRLVDTIADSLISEGLDEGDRVIILIRPSIEAVLYFFAVSRAGGVVVLADPAMGREVFAGRVGLARPTLVIMDPLIGFVSGSAVAGRIIRWLGTEIPDADVYSGMSVLISKSLSSLRNHKKNIRGKYVEERMDDSADALIVFTSGTTSVPKGVVHTFRSISSMLTMVSDRCKSSESDVFYSSQSYFVLVSLLIGARAVIDRRATFDPGRFIRITKSFGVNKVYILPNEGERLVGYCAGKRIGLPHSLKLILFGSAPALAGFLTRFETITSSRTDVKCIYGSTEILPISMIDMRDKIGFSGKGDPLGRPLSGVSVNCSEDGELIVSGPNLCDRYLHETDRMSSYATGDLGMMDPEHGIVLSGRKKDMIIKNGHNIYPSLFEPTISRIPGVGTCAMIGVFDRKRSDEDVILFIENVSELLDSDLEKRVRRELSSGQFSIDQYAVPDRISCVRIPVSGRSRKIDKGLLRTMAR